MSVLNYVPRPDGFDHVKVSNNFKQAQEEPGVNVGPYLEAFTEISRFFEMMGTLFGPMAADIRQQVRVLETFIAGPNGSNYKTIQSIIEFETQDPARIEPKTKHPSGARTVLHLNRQLDFLMQFIGQGLTLTDDARLPGMCQTVYKATLAQHVSWLITKGAHLAMYTLQTKYKLAEKVSKYPYPETLIYTTELAKSMEAAFNATNELFTKFNLHSLPY